MPDYSLQNLESRLIHAASIQNRITPEEAPDKKVTLGPLLGGWLGAHFKRRKIRIDAVTGVIRCSFLLHPLDGK